MFTFVYHANIHFFFELLVFLVFLHTFLWKKMNFLDIIIALPLGYLIYKGYSRGLIFEVASLIGIIFGSMLAVRLSNWFAEMIGLNGNSALLISFFVIFVSVLLLAILLGKLVERFVKLVNVGFINNAAGALLGMCKGVCIVGVLLYFFAIVDIEERVLTRKSKQSSMLYQPVEKAGSRLVGTMGYYAAERRHRLESIENSENK